MANARGGLSNRGSAIFLAMADQMSPSPANAASPAPTMAPVSACVVETGRPVRDATRTQIMAPASTANASEGGNGFGNIVGAIGERQGEKEDKQTELEVHGV